MTQRSHVHFLLPALALFAGACGGTVGDNPMNAVTSPDMAVLPPDLAQIPYPAGPYGVAEGDTLYPIVGKGYPLSRTVTDPSVAPINSTLSEIHIEDNFRNPACTCLVVSLAAEWCGPCNAEQTPEIDGLSADPALCAFEVLVQGPNEASGKAAVQADLDDWIGRYSHNFPVVLPSIGVTAHLPRANSLPTNVIVDPKTMKILRIDVGFNQNASYTAKSICAQQ